MAKLVQVKDLKSGDIVNFHGGTFKITMNAEFISSRDVYRAESECLTGESGGYFYPTSTWVFQGNDLRTVEVQ